MYLQQKIQGLRITVSQILEILGEKQALQNAVKGNNSGQACAAQQPGQLQSGTHPNGCPKWVTPNINTGGTTPGGMTQGPGRQGTGRRGHGWQGPGGEGGSNWGDDV